MKDLNAKIEELSISDENIDVEDFVKLIVLYVMAYLLFKRSGYHVCWSLFRYIENLEEMNEYNWAREIV